LLEYGCEVRYKKEFLEYPVKVKTPTDFKPGTKVPKMGKAPIWLVEVVMPKKLMQEIHRGSLELEGESIDAEDIEQAYETGTDDDTYKTENEQNQDATQTGAEQQQQQPAGGQNAPA
jgi:hypothetical protein